MQHYLMPVVMAVVAGGVAMLVSGNVPVAIGAGVGCAIGLWIVEKRKAGAPK